MLTREQWIADLTMRGFGVFSWDGCGYHRIAHMPLKKSQMALGVRAWGGWEMVALGDVGHYIEQPWEGIHTFPTDEELGQLCKMY